MTKREFLRAIQSRAARAAVGASAVRGGPAGTKKAARNHLRSIDLARFAVRPSRFPSVLNRETKRLQVVLPKGARWGLARKVLNIFLRDCLYTTYLENRYHLSRAEAALEIPLDRLTATALRQTMDRGALPKWLGVKHLRPSDSARFQSVAMQIADDLGIHRVHLDSVFWSQGRDEDEV